MSSTTTNPVICLSDLEFRYLKSSAPVISIAEWTVAAKERVFLFGDSGAGKSTLLHLLAGVIIPSQGSVIVNNTELTSLKAKYRDKFRAQNIGIVFQKFNLIPYLSVLDNILLAAVFSFGLTKQVSDHAKELLAQVNIKVNLWSQRADKLSLGEQQRVAIVRAMINSPTLILLDEPTSALDKKNCQAFLEVLFNLLDQTNCTLVFVSHDLNLAKNFQRQVNFNTLNQVSDE